MITRFKYLVSSMVDEWKFIFREKSILFVICAIPIIYPLILSWLYMADQPVERPTILIDDDNSAISRRLTTYLEASQDIQIENRPASIEEGWEQMRRHQAELLIYIPRNFSSKIKRGHQAKLKLWINSANMLTYGIAYPAAFSAVSHLNGELSAGYLMKKNIPPASVMQKVMPIDTGGHLLFHPTGSYGDFLIVGILMIVVQQLILISLAFSVGMRKERAMFDESSKYPFTYLEAKLLAHMVFHLTGIAIISFVIIPMFGWSMTNTMSMFILFAAFLITMAPIAISIAGYCNDRFAAFQVLMFFSTPLFMLSGFAWPHSQMPDYLTALAALFPVTPALGAAQIVTMKTGNLEVIVPYLCWMGIQFVVYTAISIVVVRKSWNLIKSQN